MVHNFMWLQWLLAQVIFIHNPRQQVLIQATPVHPNAHRFVIFYCYLNHTGKLLIPFFTLTDIAGVDAVLGQGPGTFGVVIEQLVAIEMEITNQGHETVMTIKIGANFRYRGGSIG